MVNAIKDKVYLVSVSVMLCTQSALYAQDLLSPELSEFSLEGLMQVSIASKTPQLLKDVPSTVYVYTAEDIKKHGWVYLTEIIRDVPGVDVSDTGSGAFFTTRGVADSSAHGNKTVLMINGHNVGLPSTNSINFLGLQKDINLASIKQVEILVGPGSTLHGANAFGMVIDLITYDPEDIKGVVTNLHYGNNNEGVGSVTGSFGQGKFSGLISGYYVDQSKSRMSEVKISATPGIEYYNNDEFENNFQRNYAVDGYLDYDRQLRVGFNLMHNDSGHGTVFLSTETGRRVIDKKMLYVNVNRKINRNLEYKLRSHYLKADSDPEKTKQEFTGSSNTRGSSEIGSESITLDNQLIYSINQQHTLLAGLFAERSRQRPVSGSFTSTGSPIPVPIAKPAQNWDNYALYTQWEWRPNQELYTIAGIRFVDSIKQYDSATLPQLGINYYISDTSQLKFNYQKGYRPPSAFEVGSGAAFLRPNPDLKPEYVNTYQLSFIQKMFTRHEWIATAFYSDVSNIIKRISTGDFVEGTTNPIFKDVNSDSMHIKGLEIGLKSELMKNLHVKTVATCTNCRKLTKDSASEPVIPYKLNLGINWRINSELLMVVDGYWRVNPVTSESNTIYKGQNAPDWLLVNANLRLENPMNIRNMAMNFTVRNLFNEKYSMVDRRGGATNIPAAHPGELSNIMLSVEYKLI